MPKNPLDVLKYNKKLYSAWGDQADKAASQGWYPETDFNGEVTYRSNYNHAFNNVIIPTQKENGHVALIGHPNQKFDIVIRDSKRNIVHYVYKGITPNDVQTYITNENSNVAKRNMSILKGTNPDKRQSDGSYVAIK